MPPLRLAFMGSADFSVPSLDALIAAGHDVVAVYCQPPRAAGRGQRPRAGPVQQIAEAHGLLVRTPTTLRSPDVQDAFARLALDAAVVAAYGLILPPPILTAPRLGCVNVHASLLPRWRGAAPIQRALLAGDQTTGVTIMRMDEGLDTGPTLLADTVPIGADTTAAALHDTLAHLGARLIVDALDALAAGRAVPRPQPPQGVTYAHKLTPDEGRLKWTAPAATLERMVRALNPAPGVWFEHRGERIKVLAADVTAAAAPPGTVIDEKPTVACGEGGLRLLRLQRPGRAPLTAADFLRGYALPVGTRLSSAP